jgi:plastocyanin
MSGRSSRGTDEGETVTRRRPLFLALACAALVALALGLAACGDDDDDSGEPAATSAPAATETTPATPVQTETAGTDTTASGGGATTLDVAADPSGQLAFAETALSAPAGDITLELTNESAVPHNIAVDGAEGVSDTIQDGGTADLTINLPAGEYEYYCDVPGHREAGMVGTLTVQ